MRAVVTAPLGRDAERDDVVHVYPQLHAGDVHEALHEQPSRDEEGGRQGDLRRDQRGPEPGRGARARDLSRVGADGRHQLGARTVPGREHAKENPGRDGERGREQQHRRLERELQSALRVGREQSGDSVEGPLGDDQAGQPAQRGEENRLREQLRRQLKAAGAQGQAHAHLHGAPRSPREEEIRDVGARDEEHDARHAEQHEERRLGFGVHRALTAPARGENHLLGLEAGHGRIAHPLLQGRFDIGDDGVIHGIETGIGLPQ